MCCGQKEHQRSFSSLKHGSACECECECGHSFRRYVSSKEKQEHLEEYKNQLEKELTAVDEQLAEIKDN
ncbi:hypothetical protein [uncultured Methanolobus sp.]|uniref:hypothetical protein n=1 Tax=uncultured Methanolobus sp. TaxID=218300 RepID=UPI002AAA9FAF|nr:hypothetical protein [uncultured Methanolobus sp.]